MTDFSSLQKKVEALGAMVASNSITPTYLSALLKDFITQMEAIDMTGMSDDVAKAVKDSADALKKAGEALAKAGNAETASASATANALNALEKTQEAVSAANSAKTTASQANSTASDAKAMAANAQGNANTAIQRADAANALAQKHESAIGQPSGIAPLDDNGFVPSSHLPGFVDDVVEFNATVSNITVLTSKAPKKSTDVGCMVVYDADRDLFVLAVSLLSAGITTDREWDTILRPQRATLVSPQADATPVQKIQIGDVWEFAESGEAHVRTDMFRYYYDWEDADSCGPVHDEDEKDGHEGMSGKIYTCTSNNKTYRWSGVELITIGSDLALGHTASTAFPGDEGAQLQSDLADLQDEVSVKADVYDLERVERMADGVKIFPFDGFCTNADSPSYGVWFNTDTNLFNYINSDAGFNKSEYMHQDRSNGRWHVLEDRLFRCENNLYRYDDGEMKEVGGGSSTGNVVNIHEITKDWSITNRGKAASNVPEKLRTGGRKITFMSAAGKWQTWQFTGTLLTDWDNEAYWRQEVRSVSINGAPAPDPDASGNIDLTFNVDVDATLNGESDHAVSNKAVVAGLDDVEKQIPTEFGFDAATRMFHVADRDGNPLASFNIPGGGGGGDTNPTAVEITIQSAMIDSVKEGDDYTLEYEWRHYNINSNIDTQYGGTAELIVQGSVVERVAVVQGFNTFNVGPWLATGLNTVRIRITADDGTLNQSPNVKITAVTLSLRSLYDISTANIIGSPFQLRYIVTGSGEKKVAFTVDGKDAGTETITTSGSTSVKAIPTTGMYHSVRRVDIQATRDLGGGTVLSSERISFDVMLINRDSYKPLIALERPATAQQYSTIEIPFAVYNPESNTSLVEIYLGAELVERQIVDQTRRTFSYRAKQHGELTFTFKVQNSHLSTENSVTVNVLPADSQVDAETDALSLYLTSSGRSNDAENRADWEFTSDSGIHTKAQFINCNFDAQSGWIKKNGLTALHLEKGAQCYIPLMPFATDAKQVGKTIEIEFVVSNCFDTDATVISCLSGNVGFEIKAQEAYISSALKQTVSSKFKQDERLRIGFQVEQASGTNRFMYLFINGKMSGVVQYDPNDYFVQNPAAGITMGNASCELDVYNIRIYENALTFRQMVNNYIADMDDTDVMFAKLAANDILNEDASDTEISYEKAVEKIPCITFIGELPTFKGDKKKNTKIIYEDRQHPDFSFTLGKAQNDVQGTSSQYYPRKNWKWKALEEFIMSQTGQSAKKYALRGVDGLGNEVKQKAVKTFCLKADFAESSGTHNTGAANMIHEVLKNAGIITPMQAVDDTVRTTIFGFPVLMFHQETESSPRKFIGKYNFNNDKSTHDTFGFQDIPGFNKGMVNRDDYLVWEGPLSTLQGDTNALAAAQDEDIPYYLIENGTADAMTNHLVEYDEAAGAWVDRGEMWRWDADRLVWCKRNGDTCTRAGGILDKVEAGELVENNIECWEFLNNGHPMCLFHESDYTSKIYGSDLPKWVDLNNCLSDDKGQYSFYWTGAFEPRYPDNDDNNRLYTRGRVPRQLKRITDWLASLSLQDTKLTEAEKQAKTRLFTGQISSYFDKRMALAYDIIRELFVAADQGAKNMMWLIIDGICYIIFYDNDTIWLINNEGRISFIPYVEPHSKDALGKYVFNGESSTLWNHIERGLEQEKNELYNTMVSQGGLTYARALYWFNTTQSDRWCETVYNADSKYKYIDSFGVTSEDGSGTAQNYLDIAQGSREEHRKWAMYERFQYINAKRAAGSYRDNRIYLRVNTAGESTVPAKVELNVTAAQDWYFCFRFSGNAGFSPVYIAEGDTHTFTAPEGANPNDTETYIHQADRIADLGDLSVLYPTTLEVTQGRMLQRLVVGNKTAGYRGKLASLTLGTHPLMTYINVVNIPTLTSSLDLSGCSAMEEVEAQGSRITGVNLPAGSGVKKMHLPETVVQLRFDRYPNLTNANLTVDGYANVQEVNIADCARLNPMAVLDAVTATPNNSLQYVRVTGVTLRGSGEELIRLIDMGVHGATDRLGKPEILGSYEIVKLPTSEMVTKIENGINGITIVLVVEAFVSAIDEVNAAMYSGQPEVDTVTLDNVGEHIAYYNGETYEEYLARIADENRSIHDIINE